MRRIFILLSLVMSLTAFSQTYFREGVKWISASRGIGPGPKVTETYFIQKCQDEGEEALGMYCSSKVEDSEATTAPELKCYIRTDGEKVYFKLVDTDKWYLLYDFGLNPGEGCQVNWGDAGINHVDHYSYYQRLDRIKKTSDYDGWEQMVMTCCIDDSDKGYPNVWLKGLGSAYGPLYNIAGLDGLGSWLEEVWDGDNLIYKFDYNDLYRTYFRTGVKWITRNPNPGASPTGPTTTTYYLDESQVNGEELLSMYSITAREGMTASAPRKLECYVRTDDRKVYFRPVGSEMWYLLYDFGLEPGESCTVYWGCGDAGYVDRHSDFMRLEKIEKNSDYSGWEQMCLTDRHDDYAETFSGIWLKDIGSPAGPLNNIFGLDGSFETLIRVEADGKVVYERDSHNAVSEIREAAGLDIRLEGDSLTIRGEAAAEGMVYSADGALVSRFDFRGGEKTLSLPCPGLYIVKVGGITRKVISNR